MNALLGRLLACTFLAALLALGARAQTTPAPSAYYFGTWAGAASRGAADGAGSMARFANPAALVADADGNLYVADTLNHTIRKITPTGVVSTLAGSPGESGTTDGTKSAARFYLPTAIVLHTDGNLYVGEAGGIRRVTRDGVVTAIATPKVISDNVVALVSETSGTFVAADQVTMLRITPTEAPILFRNYDFWANSRFAALARDASGTIFVAMNGVIPDPTAAGSVRNQARIYRVVENGSRIAGVYADETNGLAGVGHLNALTVDAQGNVYAAGSSGAIYRFSGGNMRVYAGMPGVIGARDGPALQALFSNLYGLAFTGSGDLYASEYNNTIRRITPAGLVSTVAGLPEEDSARHWDARGVAARFDSPSAIAVAANGVAFVADRLNHVIRRIAADGTVTTFAGGPGQAGYVDGPATQARFNQPRDLALDSAGNIYVIENSGAVRKITPAGDVSTLVGGETMPPAPAPDGQGSSAKFGVLNSIAVSPQDEIYVAEAPGYSATQGSVWARLRRISPAGVVTTISSLPVYPHTHFTGLAFDRTGVLYAADPTYSAIVRVLPQGTAERLRVDGFSPRRLAIGADGVLFMTEDRSYGATRVARYTTSGQVEVIGGVRYLFGHHDAVGTRARFSELTGIAVDNAGVIYLTDENNTVRKAVVAAAPNIVTQPASQTVVSGAGATFTVSAAATPEPAYQWYFNGTAIAGATTSSYSVASASSSNAGNYHVVVTNEMGNATSATATLTVSTPPSGGGSSGGSSSGGGGGGGAPSDFFLAACTTLALARWWQRCGVRRK